MEPALAGSTTTEQPDGFTTLGLSHELAGALAALGYSEPTAIQRAAIPPLLSGRDVLGQAATGTGKTAAFALPLLQRLAAATDTIVAPRGLVLVPTRELALQVASSIAGYGRVLRQRVVAVYGGQPIREQVRVLERGVDVVVATPGRALDHLRRGSLTFDAVEFVVLDEADEMLDMGFADELDALLEAIPTERQTALFSATMAPRILGIARKHLVDPERIAIAREVAKPGEAPRVREVAYPVTRRDKVAALARIFEIESPTATMVFCRTRTEVDAFGAALAERGYRAETLHGGLSQEQRDRVMRRFRDGTVTVLVATDVAARGLDIDHVSHVVNADVPASPDAYVHRIGRTGRAGREGVAITLLDPRDRRLMQNIEYVTKRKIAIAQLPTLDDLRTHRLQRLQITLGEALAQPANTASYLAIVDALASEHDLRDIAAAALALADPSRAATTRDVEIAPVAVPVERTRLSPSGPRVHVHPGGNGKTARIYIGAGRQAQVGPKDLVGAIAGEARIHASKIGTIRVSDQFSLVDVPESDAERIMGALRATTIRGQRPTVRLDG